MPKIIRGFRQFLLSMLSLALLFLFQNCEQPQWLASSSGSGSVPASNTNSMIGGGNGGGYDGKPDTIFYRFVPSFKCLNQTGQFYSEIILNPNSSVLVDQANCQQNSSPILFGDLQFSWNDSGLAGYQNNIFIYSSSATTPDQNTYAEAWCFDPSDKRREVIFKYNASTQNASGSFYEPNSAPLNLGALSRVISNTTALFKSSEITVNIDKNSKDSNQLYTTQVQLLGEHPRTVAMSCRLGGYLDSSLWPAQNKGEGTEILLNADKKFAFQIQNNSNDGSFSNQLVQLNLSTQQSKILVAKSYGHYGVKKIQLSNDENYILYLSDSADQPYVFNLYAYSLMDNTTRQLSASLTRPEQSVFDYRIFADNQTVFFSDAKYFDTLTNTYQLTLRKTSISGSAPVLVISDNPSRFSPGQRIILPNVGSHFLDAAIATTSQSLFYYLQISDSVTMAYDLWSYDVTTGQKLAIFKSTPDRMIIISSLLFTQAQNQALFLTVYDQQFHSEIIALKGSNVISLSANLGANFNLLAIYYDTVRRLWILLNSYDTLQELGQVSILGDDLGLVKSIAFKHSIALDQNKSKLLYIDDNENLSSYELKSGNLGKTCPSMGPFKSFGLDSADSLYGLLYSQNQTQIVKSTSANSCTVINSVPQSFSASGSLVLSPDQNSLLLNVGKFSFGSSSDAVIWMPLHGMTPVRIDTSETPGKRWQAFFNESSTQLFYFGMGRMADESILYQWPLPN